MRVGRFVTLVLGRRIPSERRSLLQFHRSGCNEDASAHALPLCCVRKPCVGRLWNLHVCPSLLAVCARCDQQTSTTGQLRVCRVSFRQLVTRVPCCVQQCSGWRPCSWAAFSRPLGVCPHLQLCGRTSWRPTPCPAVCGSCIGQIISCCCAFCSQSPSRPSSA